MGNPALRTYRESPMPDLKWAPRIDLEVAFNLCFYAMHNYALVSGRPWPTAVDAALDREGNRLDDEDERRGRVA